MASDDYEFSKVGGALQRLGAAKAFGGKVDHSRSSAVAQLEVRCAEYEDMIASLRAQLLLSHESEGRITLKIEKIIDAAADLKSWPGAFAEAKLWAVIDGR